jgi:predicted exporter
MFELNKHLIGILLGGTLISSLGAGTTYYVEEKRPSTKSVLRDFIIGAVLTLLVFQLLPESSTAAITTLGTLLPAMSGGFLTAANEDVEVKVGVPKF